LRVLGPFLPARLKKISRSKERVVTEDSRSNDQVRLAIDEKLVDLIGQIRKGIAKVDGWTELVGCQQAWGTIFLDDGHAFDQLDHGIEGFGKLGLRGLQGHEAIGCCDREGV
jgi:hypothetical protein